MSTSADLVVNMSNRKSAAYTERMIFPYATEDDLCMDLIGKARQMAVNKYKGHPWKNMSDMELLKSAGLYEKDRKTGKEVWPVLLKRIKYIRKAGIEHSVSEELNHRILLYIQKKDT